MPCTPLPITPMKPAAYRKTFYRTTQWVGVVGLLVACTAKAPVPAPEVVTVPTPPAPQHTITLLDLSVRIDFISSVVGVPLIGCLPISSDTLLGQ